MRSYLVYQTLNVIFSVGALGALMRFLALWIVVKLLCSYLSLFDTIIGLHALNEKTFHHFLIGK
jgi:hypothetical protein